MESLPYELLVRWGEDGSVSGAHVRNLIIYRDGDGEIIQRIEGEPQSLDLAGPEFEKLLGSLVIDQQLQISHLTAVTHELQEKIARLEAGSPAEPEPVVGPDFGGLLNGLAATAYLVQAKVLSYRDPMVNTEITFLLVGLTSPDLNLEDRLSTVRSSLEALKLLLKLKPDACDEINELMVRYGISPEQPGPAS